MESNLALAKHAEEWEWKEVKAKDTNNTSEANL
jgi:hypothetical protein